jgi:aminopeptidase YwaD
MRRLFILAFVLTACSTPKGNQGSDDKKAETRLLMNLKSHVYFLADDKLEGRQAGSAGEQLATEYIANQYKEIGLESKGTDGFIQQFEINEGKQVTPNSYFRINSKSLELNSEYFPLAFSANTIVNGKQAVSLREMNEPWFVDVKGWIDENKSNPHFEINEVIVKRS